MVNFTQTEYQQYIAKQGNTHKPMPDTPVIDRESDLQLEIQAYCKTRGWQCFGSRMDKRTTRPKGEADLTIATDNGKVLFVETKRKGNKPSPEQQQTLAMLRHNGHNAFMVYSFLEFLRATKECGL